MKRILLFTFTTLLLFTLMACGGGNKGDNEAANALIIGSWAAQSPTVVTESGMTITLSDMTATYAEDHTAKGSAKMSMSGAGLPAKLVMRMATTSTWKIEGNQLKETITDVDLKMLTKIPGMPDMSGMIAQGMKDEGEVTVTILKLDKNIFEFKDTDTGMQVLMKRQ